MALTGWPSCSGAAGAQPDDSPSRRDCARDLDEEARRCTTSSAYHISLCGWGLLNGCKPCQADAPKPAPPGAVRGARDAKERLEQFDVIHALFAAHAASKAGPRGSTCPVCIWQTNDSELQDRQALLGNLPNHVPPYQKLHQLAASQAGTSAEFLGCSTRCRRSMIHRQGLVLLAFAQIHGREHSQLEALPPAWPLAQRISLHRVPLHAHTSHATCACLQETHTANLTDQSNHSDNITTCCHAGRFNHCDMHPAPAAWHHLPRKAMLT